MRPRHRMVASPVLLVVPLFAPLHLTLLPSVIQVVNGYLPTPPVSFSRHRSGATIRSNVFMSASDSESNGEETRKQKKKSTYNLGSGQNKPLAHLRKNVTTSSSEASGDDDDDVQLGEASYQVRTLSDVEFWGAGYIEGPTESSLPRPTRTTPSYDRSKGGGKKNEKDDSGSSQKGSKPKRYELGMGKNSPVVLGGRKTRKLVHRDEEGKFLSRAVGSGGEGSLSGLSRVEDNDDESGDQGLNTKEEGKEGRHHVEAWDASETEANGSGLVGAHIDGPASSFAGRKSTAESDSPSGSQSAVEEHHLDDEAVEAAASAYVKALLTGEDDIGVEEEDADDILDTAIKKSPPSQPIRFEDIDLSVPLSVFDPDRNIDLVWDLMRHEAQVEADREPILVSFLHSTILNHPSLESALAFHLANKLSAPAMIATQIMTLIKEALDASPTFRRSLRADMLAVRDRDPACSVLPDVFLYFKGFHALQSYRVGHHLWKTNRSTLAHYLQSQVSQTFQIDIHPNATLLDGIMLDHGTGIVIGETAHVGHNCSILHHVTLGGSGKKGVDRHPKVGDGVLLGAGCSALGNVHIGDGCQVGAGTLVIEDLPPHSVAVGVPARIIGTFIDVATQPARNMNQLGSKESDEMIFTFETEGI